MTIHGERRPYSSADRNSYDAACIRRDYRLKSWRFSPWQASAGMGDPCFSKPQIGVCCNALIDATRPTVDGAIAECAVADKKGAVLDLRVATMP
jgi:hypothetical protein